MTEYFTFFILAFTSFFSLINPLGTMPIFMTMTADLTVKQRNNTAKKASIASLITLIFFAFSGQLLFKFFGISVNSFRMVGGIIFFLMGMDMLQARLAKTKLPDAEVKTYINDISITPLAIPMLTGPGSITNAIVLMEDATSWQMKVALILSMVAVIALTFFILFSSTKIMKLLGETGNTVLLRLMGLIVMVIAVEFFFSGLKPILVDIIDSAK